MDIFAHRLLQNLPSFANVEISELAPTGISEAALRASNEMATQGYYMGTMPDGFQVAEIFRITFGPDGGALGARDDAMVIVVDPPNDPILEAIAADVRTRFGHVDDPRALAMFLTAYSRMLLEPAQELEDRAWESRWYRYCRQNRSCRVRLGWLVKNRFGPCLPMSMLLKFTADVRSLALYLAQGCFMDVFAEPHVWTAREERETLVAYDPARLQFGTPMEGLYEVDSIQ